MPRPGLSSEDRAAQIVDALIQAGLLNPDDFERASGIVIEEIDDDRTEDDADSADD